MEYNSLDTVFIYGLTDPRTSEVRYVGKSKHPKSRRLQHLKDDERCHRVHWIKALLRNGVKPGLVILEQCCETDWREAEKRWIKTLLAQGNALTNSDPGGIGNSMSEDTRKRISEKLKGHPVTKETREKLSRCKPNSAARSRMSKAQRKRFRTSGFPDSARRKLRTYWTGRKLSDDVKRKISESKKGLPVTNKTRRLLSFYSRNRSWETRMKISIALKGKRLSEEHRHKLSLSGKGRPVSRTTRLKISKSLIGRSFSAERISNLIKGQQKRRNRERQEARARGWVCAAGLWNTPP